MTNFKLILGDLFALPFSRFSLLVGKVTTLILGFCLLVSWGISFLSTKLYQRAEKRVLLQKGMYQALTQRKKLEEEKSELSLQLEMLKNHLMPQRTKQYPSLYDYAQKYGVTFLSYAQNDSIRKSKTPTTHTRMNNYKFRANQGQIISFFHALMKDQYPLFCKSIVSNREQEDQYLIQVGMKTYNRGAK